MIQSRAFDFINILDRAADASWERNDIILNNIANATTPGYKRKDISFNSYLMAELESTSGSLRERAARADMSNVISTAYTDMSGLSYRLDGNNVDIDTENAELASNQIFYNVLIDSVNYEFNMLKSAMNKN